MREVRCEILLAWPQGGRRETETGADRRAGTEGAMEAQREPKRVPCVAGQERHMYTGLSLPSQVLLLGRSYVSHEVM